MTYCFYRYFDGVKMRHQEVQFLMDRLHPYFHELTMLGKIRLSRDIVGNRAMDRTLVILQNVFQVGFDNSTGVGLTMMETFYLFDHFLAFIKRKGDEFVRAD